MNITQNSGASTSSRFAKTSTETLQGYLNESTPAEFRLEIEAELANRNQPKAFLTVDILKNSRTTQASEGIKRIQGTVVSAELQNPSPTTQMTYGFKGNAVANINVFLNISEEDLEEIDLSMTNQVKFEVGLSKSPDGIGEYLLAASKIDELGTMWVPEKQMNVTNKVWKKEGQPDVISGTCPSEGYEVSRVYTYNNIPVISVLSTQPINLAILNSEIPEDEDAWVLIANAQAANRRDSNLASYRAKRDAARTASDNANAQDMLQGATAPISNEEAIAAIQANLAK